MLRAVRWISTAVFLLAGWSIANGHHEATFDEVIRLPALHRQADRGDARRSHLGGVDARQRIDVSDGTPHAR
jgi:hypothetical protein